MSLERAIVKLLDDLEAMAKEIDGHVTGGKCSNMEDYRAKTSEAKGIRRAKDHLHNKLKKGLDFE